MAIKITDDKHYANIAAAIRAKNGEETTYKPSEMAAAIEAITGGGKEISNLNINESSEMFTISYKDGTTVTGVADFDENGLPAALADEKGNTVTFTSGYPTSATSSDGNTVPIVWG